MYYVCDQVGYRNIDHNIKSPILYHKQRTIFSL